jgi:hypothetical protein
MCGTITQARAFKVRATAFRKQQKVTGLSLKKFFPKTTIAIRLREDRGRVFLLTATNTPIRPVKTEKWPAF